MTPAETNSLFDYIGGLYGQQFKTDEADQRLWQAKLYAVPLDLVRRAVDVFADQSEKDFPPSLVQLKKTVRTLRKNTQLREVSEFSNFPQIESKTTWREWAVMMADRLLFCYSWKYRPNIDGAEIFKKAFATGLTGPARSDWIVDQITIARRKTEEFTDIVEDILEQVPEHFADWSEASDCPQMVRVAGIKKIYIEMGAVKPITVDMFQKMPV